MELTLNTNKEGYSKALKKQAGLCIPILEDGEAIWDSDFIEFVKAMKTLLQTIPGAKALAANQCWSPDLDIDLPAVFVMRFDNEVHEFINTMVKGTGKSLKEDESCISFPNKIKYKRRHKNAVVAFQTLKDIGKQLVTKLGGLDARALQHEIDHLHGKTLFPIKTK